ncbi:MAG: hypothetical protein KC443_04725 [Anaerolineales bacterium]|nr:hypothetical protein [Anaerolineales bacterium]
MFPECLIDEHLREVDEFEFELAMKQEKERAMRAEMNLSDVQDLLADPFPASEVQWKAQATSRDKTRALAVAYIDARNVMERLDSAVSPANWSDSYRVVEVDGRSSVECTLTVCGVSKTDVGTAGESADPAKAAYSDALKRAAVKFGIGRYLYALPKQWVAYDEQRKQLAVTPVLPQWAVPSGSNGSGSQRHYANGQACSPNNSKPFDAYVEVYNQPPSDYAALKTWAANRVPANGNGHLNGKSLAGLNDELFG